MSPTRQDRAALGAPAPERTVAGGRVKLDQLYQEIILDHYKRPHGRGLREPFDAEVHHVNPTCGDEVTLRVRVADGVVTDVSYEGMGCSISQASASVLHDLVSGSTVAESLERHDAFAVLMAGRGQVEPDEALLQDAVAFAGVAKYPARVKCALLAWMAYKDALSRAVADRTEVPTT
jgi:nitrogen fixation NifU-like protein